MTPTERVDILLIGGGVASVRCARTLRRHGFDGSILVVGTETMPPYNRPPLSKELLRDDLPDDLVLAEPAGWYARREVGLELGRTVVQFDPDARTAALDDGTLVEFDRCLLATGAEPRRLTIDGGERALLLRTLPDARALRSAAQAAGTRAAVTVIGGGFIGVEVASALAALGLRPTIVEMANRLWGGALGEVIATWGADLLARAGVTVRLGAGVDRLDEGAAWIGGERLEHAFAVAGIGVAPRVRLGEAAGLETRDGILTDAGQRTSHPAVWAAGDVARVDGRRVEHWHAAREAGERAAMSMLGMPVPPIPAPWIFSEVGGTTLDVIGDATGWTEERWVRDGSVLACLDRDRVVQLAVIGSALEPSVARGLVERAAALREVEAALEGLASDAR